MVVSALKTVDNCFWKRKPKATSRRRNLRLQRTATMRRRVQPDRARGYVRRMQSSPHFLKLNISRCSAVGSAPVSGHNHRSRRRIFEKSRKPLKTLTFSALPNVEKSSIPRSDHMFDHLQKNLIILPFRGVAKVVSRIVRDDEIAGSSPVTSTKKTAENKLF